MTMTKGEMLTKLYDEIIKQLNNGIHHINANDIASADPCLQKARTIFDYLQSTLDKQYDISANLQSLYRFFNEQIMTAIIRKQVKPLEEIIPMVEELKDAFIQADKSVRMNKQTPATRVG